MDEQTVSTVLSGRVAVVFGATGWIGRAICRDLISAGASVVMVGRSADRLNDLHRELGGGSRLMWALADVTSQLEVDDARSAALARFGHIDLLVVSSGVISGSAFSDGVPADWAEMIDVNLRGLLHASQTFAEPLLQSARRGLSADLLLVGSVSTDARAPLFAVFNALSAAIKELARALRHEYGSQGMRVHIVEPGFAVEGADAHGPTAWLHRHRSREASAVTPDAIAAVVTLTAALPSSVNLAEVLLLPTGTGTQ